MSFCDLFKFLKKDSEEKNDFKVVPVVGVSDVGVRVDTEFLELTSEQQGKLREIVVSLLGVPYKLGAEVELKPSIDIRDIRSIDCSELVEVSYYKIRIKVRDGSWNQYDDSKEIVGEPEIGDLYFRRSFKTKQISHVGVYVGFGEVVEANGLAQHRMVIKRDLEDVKEPSILSEYVGVRRLLISKVKFL